MTYGPWSPGVEPGERRAQLRCLAGLVAAHFGSAHHLVPLLRQAEEDESSLKSAALEFERLPTLKKRHLLSMFAAVTYERKAGK